MTPPQVHLRVRRSEGFGHEYTVCNKLSKRWTDDPQAVTCKDCIGHMELQSA